MQSWCPKIESCYCTVKLETTMQTICFPKTSCDHKEKKLMTYTSINVKTYLCLEWRIREKRKENKVSNNIHHHSMYPCILLKFSYINQTRIMRKTRLSFIHQATRNKRRKQGWLPLLGFGSSLSVSLAASCFPLHVSLVSPTLVLSLLINLKLRVFIHNPNLNLKENMGSKR